MDPISDMFIRIKNAQRAKHEMARIPYSQFKYEIAQALARCALVGMIDRKGKRVRKVMDIELLYREGKSAITGIRLISKPSRRLYVPYRDICRAPQGGILLISTPQGVMSGQEARRKKVGGELLVEIW